jgi:hypothetical protein
VRGTNHVLANGGVEPWMLHRRLPSCSRQDPPCMRQKAPTATASSNPQNARMNSAAYGYTPYTSEHTNACRLWRNDPAATCHVSFCEGRPEDKHYWLQRSPIPPTTTLNTQKYRIATRIRLSRRLRVNKASEQPC